MISKVLWVAQVLLALGIGSAGIIKLISGDDVLLQFYPIFPPLFIRFIGVCEILGAIGVIVPAATRIRPELTPLAAAGLTDHLAIDPLPVGGFRRVWPLEAGTHRAARDRARVLVR
jgi:hypothetical protein